MKKQYRHLSSEERAILQIEVCNGASIRSIARRLNRSASTLSRELGRQGEPTFVARLAAQRYQRCRRHSVHRRNIFEGSAFQDIHDDLVLYRWSPQQIAAKLLSMHSDDPTPRMSHETIYVDIYAHPRGGLKKELVEALRQRKPTRGLRRTTAAKRSWVPEQLRIIHRPEEVEQRLISGRWEGDLIKGVFNRSCVGALVELKTRFVVLCKMSGCTSQDALEGFARQMKKLPHFLLCSLTYDRGSEMTCYPELMKRLNIDLWFADPHAPWQRGSNVNPNGLLRQFMTKGADLSKASQEYLNNVAELMNARPRKMLGWKTPNQALVEELAQFNSRVALAS